MNLHSSTAVKKRASEINDGQGRVYHGGKGPMQAGIVTLRNAKMILLRSFSLLSESATGICLRRERRRTWREQRKRGVRSQAFRDRSQKARSARLGRVLAVHQRSVRRKKRAMAALRGWRRRAASLPKSGSTSALVGKTSSMPRKEHEKLALQKAAARPGKGRLMGRTASREAG